MILPEHEANRMLADAGMPMIAMREVKSAEDARMRAGDLGCPVALKLSSVLYSHKTEVGGVLLNLASEEDVGKAFEKLEKLRDSLDSRASIIMEPMAPTGTEFFIGFQLHPQFGPVMGLGLGGVWLELIQDVTFRLLPARMADFREMCAELKSWSKLQRGYRNLPPLDEGILTNLMEKTAEVALSHPEIVELDLNPVVVRSDGAIIVDARVLIDSSPLFFEAGLCSDDGAAGTLPDRS
jgi:acyl-CoA synthetase (NDP forming)